MLFETVRTAIKARYPAMSRQLQIGARFLLERPEEVATASMRAVASRAGVTPVTLVRLARALGFADWQELRRPFVERLKAAAPFSARAEGLVKRRSPAALVAESFAAHAANLAATQSLNPPDAVEHAAALLARARRVYVAGFRSCHALAAGFVYVYRLFRPEVVLVGGSGLGLELELRALGAVDAVLLLGFAPYSRESALVAEAARRAGARRIAVTDSDLAPLALGADSVLRFAHAGPSFFPSIAAASALLEALLAVLLARGGKNALGRLRAAERELATLGAYLPEGKAAA